MIATATAAFGYFYTRGTVKQNIFDQLEIAADVLLEQVHTFLDEKKDRTLGFSSDGLIREYVEEISGKEKRSEYYTTILNNHLATNKKTLNSSIVEVFIVDFQGKVIISTDANRIGEDVLDKKYFSEAEILKVFVSDPHYGPCGKGLVIDFSTVLLSKIKQEPIGIIVNRIKIEQDGDWNQDDTSVPQESDWNYSRLIAVNKARTIDFSSDGFIRDCTEEITRREDRLQYYTDRLNTHIIRNKQPLDPDILAVFITDLNGKIISSSEIGQIGKDVSDKVYYLTTMKRGSCVSDLYYSSSTRQGMFEVSRLLLCKDGQRIIGIIVNRYSGDSLKRITHSGISELEQGRQLEGLGETGELYIVNRDKLMITESRFKVGTILKQIVDTEGVRTAFNNGVGMIGIYTGYRGIPVIGVSRYVESVDWVVLAEKDVSEAFAPLVRLRNITILIGIVGIVIVVIIAIFIATGITRPIQKFVEGTRKISEGNLAYRIETGGRDEIGYLATSFNDMTYKLEESKKQLQDYTDHLEEKVEDKIGEIKRGKEYTDNLIETAQDAIVCADEKGMINVWNRMAEKIFGYSRSEIMGESVTTIIPEKYKKEHQKGMKRFLETHKPVIIGRIIEVTGRTKDGTEIPIEISLSDHKEEEKYSFTAILRDITEKKKVEGERKRILDELRFKNQELEQIIYTVSHDLRSPLVNIMGFSKELDHTLKEVHSILNDESISSALEHKLAPALDEDIPEALKFILTSTSKMDSLLNGLLRISRMGQAKFNIKRLDMNSLVSNVVNDFKHRTMEMGITIKVGPLPSCNGDEVQINQVFSNLLDNAMKYLDSGRPGIIRISGTRQLVYCVEDNGVGIAQEYQNKIFEIFHRLNPDSDKGEGLGLSIVRRILDKHGGKIWCESRPGKGSKFFVALSG